MNVLLATDGSDCAMTAARLLASLPLPAEAHVIVLGAAPEHYWVDTPPLGGEASVYPWLSDLMREEEAAARRATEDAAALLRERGVSVTTHFRRQSPVPAILDQAQEDGAELIVLGSHGKGAMEKFLVGSVSERVARYAHCSVLVARGEAVRRAIVAVDGSESAEHALEALARLPLPAETKLTALHVLTPAELRLPFTLAPMLSSEEAIEQYDREARALGERVVLHARERLRAAGHTAETDVRCGTPADEIVAAARETDADLIVVGAHNRSTIGRLFLGSVSGRVLGHAPCSVLIARVEKAVAPSQEGV